MAWGSSTGLNQKMTSDKKKQITGYKAKLAGDKTKSWGGTQYSVYPYTYDGNESGVDTPSVAWGQANVLSNVNGTDYTNQTTENATLSAELAKIPQNGAVTVSKAPPFNGYTRYKYDNSQSFNGFTHAEKLLTFTGDGESLLQSFTIDANVLSQIKDSTGVSYWFRNIPENASVVVNVTGTTDGMNVSFQNGWRFWWGGDAKSTIGSSDVKEISNGYVKNNENAEAYAHAAQSIMWNFTGIRSGGTLKIQGGQNTKNDDDPAAAMLGSILVPYGSFESHVTTNGRVMVGEDFAMANPRVAKKFGNTDSASIIDMDQERHNLPWNGSYTSECSIIGWQKVDTDNTDTKLAGSKWGVYADANATQLLLTVSDNGSNDSDANEGVLTVRNLNPNATYYIKELQAPDGYQIKETVYSVTTSQTGEAINYVTGDVIDDTTGKITNKKSGNEIAWSKVDADDTSKELAGSEWQIQQAENGSASKSWNVKDNTNEATNVTASASSTTLDSDNPTATLTATVQPGGALQKVTWAFTDQAGSTSESSSEAAALGRTGDLTAAITGTSSTDVTVYVKACSVSNPDVCSAPVAFTVKAMSVKDFSVKDSLNKTVESDSTVTAASVGSALTFTASSTPAVPITWSSGNASVATVTSSGENGQKATVTMTGFGSAVITAKAGDQTISFTVKVPSTTVYFKKSLVSDWSKYYVYYNDGNNNWKFVEMSQSCGDYVYAILPKQSLRTYFLFHGDDENTSTNKWYQGSNKSNFEFMGNEVQVVNQYNDSQVSTAPAGCPASAAAAAQSNDAAVLNENAMVTPADDSQPSDAAGVAENAVDDGAKAISCTASDGADGNPGVKCDTDTAAGKFKVGGLDAGTYWLHEITAPDGYTINKTLYQFTIDADGNVTWNGGWASGNATGDIDENLKPGADNAISDTPTEVTWNKVDTKGGKLAGSQWKIVGPSPVTDVYCVADNVTVDTNGDTTPAGTEFADCTGEKLSDADTEYGVIKVKGLPVGTYALTETKAPDGYVATTTVYTLTISGTEASAVVAQPATETPATRSGGNRGTEANVPNTSAPVNIQIPVKKSVKYTSWPKDGNGNYVSFKFKVEATSPTVDANPAAPMPAECSSDEAKKNCTISLAPESGATDLTNVIAKFGDMTFTDANLAAEAGDGKDYAKTYTYKITEIAPDSADAVENLRYSKAEYRVVVTVKQAKDSIGKLAGLSVSVTMTRTTDDSGNTEANGGKVVGTWSSTSTSSTTGNAVEATFVNTKVLTGLPTTGTDWTGHLVLLVGGGFILAGVLIAGGYQLVQRRREEDSD